MACSDDDVTYITLEAAPKEVECILDLDPTYPIENMLIDRSESKRLQRRRREAILNPKKRKLFRA